MEGDAIGLNYLQHSMKFLILFFAALALVAADNTTKDKRDILIARGGLPYAYAADAAVVAYAAPVLPYPSYPAYTPYVADFPVDSTSEHQ